MLSAEQLADFDLGGSAISKRVRRKILFWVVRCVYSLLPPPYPFLSRAWAAQLWGGEKAVLAEWTSGQLNAVTRPRDRRIDIIPGSHRRSNHLLNARRSAPVHSQDIAEINGLRTTNWARTALDLAARERERTVERLLNGAMTQNLFDLKVLDDVIERHPGHHGHKTLAAALRRLEHSSTLTDSELEEAFLAICDAVGLPRPITQWGVGGRRCDFHWPALGLVVEVNSWKYHRSRDAFDRDADKALTLIERGVDRIVFTDGQIEHERPRVARIMRAEAARRLPRT